MTPDLSAVADAIAARFALVAAPAGYTVGIRLATADAPEQLATLPALLVLGPVEGEFDSGGGANSERQGGHDFLARFYWSQTPDLTLELASLRAWVTVLVDALKGAAALGGLVTHAAITGYAIDGLTYAGKPYAGVELDIHVVTNEAWTVTP